MLEFHPLKVAAVERVAEDAACVTVEIPSALRDAFAFHAGQYVTVRRMIEGREERRTYSIVTAPGGGVLKLGIRLQLGGRMSGELASTLRPGDLLDVGTPMGRFRTSISADREHSYVAFTAGSGITPILSLATDILAREPRSRFTLIYGNRSISRTMFLEETLGLKNRYIDRFSVHFVMSREPQQTEWLNGRIDGHKIRELARHMPEVSCAGEFRTALFLPVGHLRDLPRENHGRRRGDDAQYCLGTLGDRRRVRAVLSGSADDGDARNQLRSQITTNPKGRTCHTTPFCSVSTSEALV